jgi:hypothetical protein
MESNLTQCLKKSNKPLENIFKKTEFFSQKSANSKNSKRNHYSKSAFETTVLPLIYVKQSLKQNRKDVFTYSTYNKQDLNSSYDTKDHESENGLNNSVNSKILNNFSKILVTLKVKKETSLRNNFLYNDQLPLLKTAINNYNSANLSSYDDYSCNNNINSNKLYNTNSFKRQNIYSPYEFLDNYQMSPYYDKKRANITHISESPVPSSHNEQTSRISNLKNKSLIWKNMEKFLNTKSPENPPGTPNLLY